MGSVKLASSDPFTFPLMNPNFFSTEFDRFAMLEAVKGARRFAATAPWQGFIVSRFGVMGAAETDDEINAAARDSVVTIWHPASSARMSPRGAKFGVVDPDLLVKGVAGLRIVDASVFVSRPGFCALLSFGSNFDECAACDPGVPYGRACVHRCRARLCAHQGGLVPEVIAVLSHLLSRSALCFVLIYGEPFL